MIIGPDFVWLHFPKCAGVAVESALRTLLANRAGIAFDPIDPSNMIWHHTVRNRERYDPTFLLEGRRVICGFRRLPMWVLSRVHFEAGRGPDYRTVTRKMLLQGAVYESNGDVRMADAYASRFSTPRVDNWIRTEHLVKDLSAAFALEPGEVEKALAVRNATEIAYLKPLSFWFTDGELRSLYKANPIWTRIEKQVYGTLLAPV